MKLKITLSLFCAAALCAVVSAIAINRQVQTEQRSKASQRVFEVRGVVLEIEAGGKTLRIQHEEIPNYMPAMVMPFEVRHPAVAKGIVPGDSVSFQFVVSEDDSWIARIQKTGRVSGGPTEPATNPAADADRLQPGERVPDFALVDQSARPFRLSDYRGKAVLVTFIYTRCPIPNFCPLMSKNFAALQARLAKDIPGKFQLLSVTIDPEFDRSEILEDYGNRYSENRANWTFATGTPEQIDLVTGLFGLTRQAEGGLISHNLSTALIGPDGRLVHIWKSNVWTPYEVHRRIKEILSASS